MHRTTTAPTPAIQRPRPRPHADRMLVCLSYCGGGTAPFRKWADAVPDDVELALVCYPGREARRNEPPASDWITLRDDVVRAVAGVADRPYTLFGHSMGSLIAFETAARLERLDAAPPEALVVSGGVAPHRRDRVRAGLPRSDDSDEAVLAWMCDLGQMPDVVVREPYLRRLAIDLARADLAVSESYRFAPGSRVTMPVRMLYGAEDREPFAEVEREWRTVAGERFEAFELPGGHFYTPEVWAGLPAWCSAGS
ncbi:thioesterase II family protein [Streptomyces sp. TR06-5]|uniref:thioesterase II family protein n=1 Tax=unclassified Streptomyces TaxID=2593676 RepID=UPI0039A07880